MSYQFSSISDAAVIDQRRAGRDEVHYRTRAFGPDAKSQTLLVVNLSPHGMMARCEAPFAPGDRLRVMLPVVGVVVGEVRWALGGRVGMSFDAAIDLTSYYELLATVMKKA